MKIALLTAIASLSHIGVYLLVRQADIIPQELNVYALWGALALTFAFSFTATLNQAVVNGNR